MEHTKLFPSSTFIDLTGQRFHRLRVLRFAAEHWRKSYTLSLRWEGKRGRIRRVKYWKTALAILAVLSTSLAVAEDFKTTNGKEYKNATVTRVEPDGIVVKTKSGISKVYFLELPKDVQERFHYDKDQATAYAADQNAKLGALGKQQEESLGLAARSKAAQRSLTIFPAKSGGLRIEHESYAQLFSEAKTKATNLNYNEDRTNALVSSIPAGGRLVLHIERSTIGAANTQYFTVIILDRTGKEILRRGGSDSIAEIPDSNDKWWNIMIVDLPEIYETPLRIRVVDALHNEASEFSAR